MKCGTKATSKTPRLRKFLHRFSIRLRRSILNLSRYLDWFRWRGLFAQVIVGQGFFTWKARQTARRVWVPFSSCSLKASFPFLQYRYFLLWFCFWILSAEIYHHLRSLMSLKGCFFFSISVIVKQVPWWRWFGHSECLNAMEFLLFRHWQKAELHFFWWCFSGGYLRKRLERVWIYKNRWVGGWLSRQRMNWK